MPTGKVVISREWDNPMIHIRVQATKSGSTRIEVEMDLTEFLHAVSWEMEEAGVGWKMPVKFPWTLLDGGVKWEKSDGYRKLMDAADRVVRKMKQTTA